MSKGPNDKDYSKSEALNSHEKPQIESLGAWIGVMTCVYLWLPSKALSVDNSLLCSNTKQLHPAMNHHSEHGGEEGPVLWLPVLDTTNSVMAAVGAFYPPL